MANTRVAGEAAKAICGEVFNRYPLGLKTSEVLKLSIAGGRNELFHDPRYKLTIMEARRAAMFELYKRNSYTLSSIAALFNLTNHTSVLYEVRKHEVSLGDAVAIERAMRRKQEAKRRNTK